MSQLKIRAQLVLFVLLLAVAISSVVATPVFAEICGVSGSTGC